MFYIISANIKGKDEKHVENAIKSCAAFQGRGNGTEVHQFKEVRIH